MSSRRHRLRSPRALALYLALTSAGAAAIACLDLIVGLGVKIENIFAVDSKGVIRAGRGVVAPRAVFAGGGVSVSCSRIRSMYACASASVGSS